MTDASELAALRARLVEMREALRKIEDGFIPHSADYAATHNWRGVVIELQAIARAALVAERFAGPTAQRDMVVVPRDPDREMIDAGCQAMRRRKEAMGDDCVRVSNREKMHIRWKAMLDNWSSRAAAERDA